MVLLKLVGHLMGKLLGNDCDFEDESLSPCFRPGFLLDCGIYWVQADNTSNMRGQTLRRFFIAGVAVGGVEDKMISHKCDQVCRASELPIYIYEQKRSANTPDALCPPQPGVLQSAVRSVRESVMSVVSSIQGSREQCEDYLKEGSTKAGAMVKYLSEESNDATKMGAVGIGALTGFILGLRGGFFRRLIFSGTGAYAMCALAYPTQTSEYTKYGLQETKKYVKITYNFIYGVDPSKKEEEWHLPQIPKSFDEAWQVASNIGKSASAMITGQEDAKPVKEEKQPKGKKE